ncbi:calpain family cysteine peptidase [Jiangella alkaliphila]|uniref:Calpain catalytic domain-containing protein n=1 Tax=Jiangella alkaliphila TaxID=419479 RepID=A0A1H2LSX7_9ACTN|nr:C2 family cysteine protease [Jiangella alkaliphila]SDU83952.1 hypothetical protein SAMN04488563_6596 [Jiangella alkaliphila]
MPERPIRAAVQALTSLRAAAGAEFDDLRAATAGRVDVVGRAAAGAPNGPAGPNVAAVRAVARSLTELADLARPMAAVVDEAAESALRAVDAEVARLLALLHDTPQTGRRPPLLAPTPPVAGGPAPAPAPLLPAPAPEPELTHGVHYAEHPLTLPASVGPEFVRQGGISDCHLVAALATVADRAPWLLPAVSAGDGTVMVDVPGRRYRLRPTLPVDDGSGELAYAHSPDGSTLAPYVEKAFAVYGGGYAQLGRGGLPVEALYWLTGRPSYLLRVANAGDDIVAGLVESGQPAVACSRPLDDDRFGVAAALRYQLAPVAHAYAVRGLDPDDQVLLHNPWGRRHPRPVPLDVFCQLFTRIDWCESDDDD